MNLEKVIFGFFVLLAATLNFGFFIGDIADPAATRTLSPRGRCSSSRRSSRTRKSSSGLATTRLRQPRWKDTVSTTSRVTDTMLASSAPPDSETTLAVHAAVSPAVET